MKRVMLNYCIPPLRLRSRGCFKLSGESGMSQGGDIAANHTIMDTDSRLFKNFVRNFHGRRNMPERGQTRLVRDSSCALYRDQRIIDKNDRLNISDSRVEVASSARGRLNNG